MRAIVFTTDIQGEHLRHGNATAVAGGEANGVRPLVMFVHLSIPPFDIGVIALVGCHVLPFVLLVSSPDVSLCVA